MKNAEENNDKREMFSPNEFHNLDGWKNITCGKSMKQVIVPDPIHNKNLHDLFNGKVKLPIDCDMDNEYVKAIQYGIKTGKLKPSFDPVENEKEIQFDEPFKISFKAPTAEDIPEIPMDIPSFPQPNMINNTDLFGEFTEIKGGKVMQLADALQPVKPLDNLPEEFKIIEHKNNI